MKCLKHFDQATSCLESSSNKQALEATFKRIYLFYKRFANSSHENVRTQNKIDWIWAKTIATAALFEGFFSKLIMASKPLSY